MPANNLSPNYIKNRRYQQDKLHAFLESDNTDFVIGEEDVPIEKLKQSVRKRKQQRSVAPAQILYKTNQAKTCKIGDGTKFECVTIALQGEIVTVDAVKVSGKKQTLEIPSVVALDIISR